MKRVELVLLVCIAFITTATAQMRSIEIATANDYSFFFDENPPRTTYAKLWTPTTLSLTA